MPSPQQVNWAKFRASAVILAGLLILGTVAFLLTGGTFFEPRTLIYLYLPDATGVAAGSPVRVDGIGVGKVTLVELSGSNEPNRVVKVTMSIERHRLTSITDDATAETTSDTIIGDKFVDVTSGSGARHLLPGGELQFKGSGDLMQRLDLAQFQQRLHVIEVLLDDIEQGRSPLGEFIMGETIYNDLRRKVTELQRGIHVAADTTTAVGQALYTDSLYRKVSQPLRQLDESLARLQSGQGAGGALLRDTRQHEEALAQIAGLRRSIRNLHGAEIMTGERSYDDWTRQVAAIIRQVDQFNAGPALTTSAAYDNLRGMAGELQVTTKEFRENPRKFLRIKLF
ncbi:MAG: MlaD family protein [Candidatus Solibacter sp.]|nr:MlaD family protein [Candidatus Solibacter sp.]